MVVSKLIKSVFQKIRLVLPKEEQQKFQDKIPHMYISEIGRSANRKKSKRSLVNLRKGTKTSTMKTQIVFILLLAYLRITTSFMNVKDFDRSGLKRCYERGTLPERINGQELPLPSSIETFVSLIERIESKYSSMAATDIIKNLLMSFRVDELAGDFRSWPSPALFANDFERLFFSLPTDLKYEWQPEDFTDDEKCALHFMLSHTINATAWGNEEVQEDGTVKRPREYGVVSLHSKWKHAFSLAKVLLGILSGLSGNNERNAAELYRSLLPGKRDENLNNVKVNRLYAVTLGDLVSHYANKVYKENEQITFVPNGMWNDVSCPTYYILSANNFKYVTNSVLRGAIDGLIIGRKLEEKAEIYQKIKLSKILRMYYGPTGLIDEKDTSNTRNSVQWCERERNFEAIQNTKDELYNFYLLYTNYLRAVPSKNSANEVNEIINNIQKSPEIFSDISAEASSECVRSDVSPDKKCSTPFDIFAILDWGTDIQRNFQAEIIGNLSVNFDVGPQGSSIGVYSNMKSQLSRGLNTIVNNTGASGCQSCFTKYYQRSGGKNSDVEVIQKLNETLTDFEEEYDLSRAELSEIKSGNPAKFKPMDDGGQIKVCFTRSAYIIMEDNPQQIECYESSEEIRFFVRNPCHRRNVHNCDPFYFTVEGKKPPTLFCQNAKCNTPKDILFEFQHEGISCNTASFISISTLSMLFAVLLFIIQKQ
ncbi:uncharacterized protein NPIL_251571 [Nephila pilipes]|uniref:Uncharacterized protein n=1 Tax=Nephila pilipes TaxID=299642 RepID=A0A8X6R2Y0_NEPPI|nr:uncharacterized protein NPIL_251571 [Nephila pilipes]